MNINDARDAVKEATKWLYDHWRDGNDVRCELHDNEDCFCELQRRAAADPDLPEVVKQHIVSNNPAAWFTMGAMSSTVIREWAVLSQFGYKPPMLNPDDQT
jgi:hypothetical protein